MSHAQAVDDDDDDDDDNDDNEGDDDDNDIGENKLLTQDCYF